MRLVCLVALASLVVGVCAERAAAEVGRLTNPLRIGGQPLACPDPDVFRVPWLREYVAACTSDYGQDNPGGIRDAAFPMYVSRDLQNWRFENFVFPAGRHPWQASPPTGGYLDGRYWGPEIHRIQGRWVIYFGARLDPVEFERIYHQAVQPNTFGLFVAWTDRLFGGDWHSRLLHYRGQFNQVPGNSLEIEGGVIDPSVARDPATGQLYIAYAKQANQIFIGELSADGLYMSPHVHVALGPRYDWECDPGPLGIHAGCCVEGPVLYADRSHHVLDMFFNSASTWTGSYKVGVAVSVDPMKRWVTYPEPILRSGEGLLGPGIGAQPLTLPDGNAYVFFHVQLRPTHVSQARYLALAPLTYVPAHTVQVERSANGLAVGGTSQGQPAELIPVPQVGDGLVPSALQIGG